MKELARIGLPNSAINEADEDEDPFGVDQEIREQRKEEESDEEGEGDSDSNEGESAYEDSR